MIYPTLHLNQEETTIEYIDTTFNDNPFLITSIPSQEEAVEAWFDLLTAFVNQYWIGYDMGYDDSLSDTDSDIDEEEQGDIQWI